MVGFALETNDVLDYAKQKLKNKNLDFIVANSAIETGSGFGGAGVSWKHFRLDLSVNFHPQLGFTPGLLLIVQLKRKRG